LADVAADTLPSVTMQVAWLYFERDPPRVGFGKKVRNLLALCTWSGRQWLGYFLAGDSKSQQRVIDGWLFL